MTDTNFKQKLDLFEQKLAAHIKNMVAQHTLTKEGLYIKLCTNSELEEGLNEKNGEEKFNNVIDFIIA